MKNTKTAKPALRKQALPKSKSKAKGVSKKSQQIKDKEAQKDLDSLLSASSIFADLQSSKPESKKQELEKKIQLQQEKKEKAKLAKMDMLSQLESISNFSL